MVDTDTFLTTLYVMVDDFCKSELSLEKEPDQRLREALPTLPNRSQFNRLARKHRAATVTFLLHLVKMLQARHVLYEILDTSGIPVRNVKRRSHGWLAGMANIGWCTRIGWFNGLRLLIAVNPEGARPSQASTHQPGQHSPVSPPLD